MVRDNIKKMVERVDWLSPIDYEILQFYDNHDIQMSPAVLAANIGYDDGYTGKRLRSLRDAGLLEQPGQRDFYQLSDLGRQFLAGDLDGNDCTHESAK